MRTQRIISHSLISINREERGGGRRETRAHFGNACDAREKNWTYVSILLTFAVTEFFRTLRSECYRGGTNQPPKRTQQHHYHFTVDIMFTKRCALLLFPLWPRVLQNTSLFYHSKLWRSGRREERWRYVISVSIICANLKGYRNAHACYKNIHYFRVNSSHQWLSEMITPMNCWDESSTIKVHVIKFFDCFKENIVGLNIRKSELLRD